MRPEDAFDRYHQAIYGYAYALTRRTEIAEDITQECFLALIRAPERFDESRGSMKTYLLSITRNLAFKHYRETRFALPLDFVPTTDPTAKIEVSTAVAAAVESLTHWQQEILILFEFEGLSLEEVASVVGTNVGVVKSRLHRARERLKLILAPLKGSGGTHGRSPRVGSY